MRDAILITIERRSMGTPWEHGNQAGLATTPLYYPAQERGTEQEKFAASSVLPLPLY